jgi:hypothetical protein
MLTYLKQCKTRGTDESGFILIFAMVALLSLTLLCAWGLKTSNFDLQIADGLQRVERQFNIAEGAANTEAGKVGFVTQVFYQIFDPTRTNQLLTPDTDATFDPGNDTATAFAGITANVPTTWPWENLLRNYTNLPTNANEFDYRYLVTYLYEEDSAYIGYSAEDLSAYKFQIQGVAAISPAFVELGGAKMGPKSNL